MTLPDAIVWSALIVTLGPLLIGFTVFLFIATIVALVSVWEWVSEMFRRKRN